MSPNIVSKTMDLIIHSEIDTSGTRCPLPLLRAKQALKTMSPAQHLRVLTTDPAAKSDFDAMLSHLPHELVAYSREALSDGDYEWVDSIVIRKGEST